MHPRKGLTSADFDQMEDMFHIQFEDELLGQDWLQLYATEILDARYQWTDVRDVVENQQHLTARQKCDLLDVLKRHQRLFDGTLGIYPHKKVHIDIEPDAKPVHARPYPVPRIHLSTYKRELDHLCDLGVLVPQQESEWASPSFIIPKKDGSVRWISDLRQLNKVIKRKQYPLPAITDILCKRIGYKFFTKLDISMQYYTFELDDESQDLCTIITPFGKYKYTRLPMGLKCSPDIAQSIMEKVLSGIDAADVYIKPSPHHGKSTLPYLIPFCVVFATTVSLLTRLNANGPSRKRTGLVIGSHHVALNLGKRKFTQSCT